MPHLMIKKISPKQSCPKISLRIHTMSSSFDCGACLPNMSQVSDTLSTPWVFDSAAAMLKPAAGVLREILCLWMMYLPGTSTC